MSMKRDGRRNDDVDGYALSKEIRRKRAELFIQEFEKEAQNRINEMVSKMDQMLATVDRVFKVELMKMPPALQNTLVRDIIEAEKTSAGDVTIAMQTESPEIAQPLSRKLSKRVKICDQGPKLTQQSASKKPSAEPSKRRGSRTRPLVPSNSTGSLRSARTTIASKRTKQRVYKLSDPAAVSKPTHRHARDRQHSSSMDHYSSHFTITNSQGETFNFSEETDVELLNGTAVLEIQRLKKLMDYLASKVSGL